MPPLRSRLEQAQDRLGRKLAASQRLRAAPDQEAAPLLFFLIPLMGMIWGAAWWLAGSSQWITVPFGTVVTMFVLRCLPGQVIPMHPRVVPPAAGWFLAGWLILGWGGMVWLLAG